MFTSPLFRRLFVPYLLLICFAIAVVGVVGAQRLRSSYEEHTRRSMVEETQLIAELLGNRLDPSRAEELKQEVARLGQAINHRITIVAGDGTVLADNEADPAKMDNHRLRPEIVTAVNQGIGDSIRPSGTLHEEMFYFARRVDDHRGVYYIRLSVHLRDLERNLKALYASLGLAAGLALLGAGAICYYFAVRFVRPIVQLTRFADGVRQGDLSRRMIRKYKGELGTLAGAMDSMAQSLARLLSQASKDKAELLAILSSMSEGVIATDVHQRILQCNASAGKLLEFKDDQAAGRMLWELVRHQAIAQAATEVLQGGHRRMLEVGPIAGRHLNVTLCGIPGSNQLQGLVIVAHDVTQMVRYQELRKEFVANVSHELRTPLSAIKGYAETLREGALDDPVRGPQFLATIEKHADQLANLVQDLLELSRLENQGGLAHAGEVDLGQTVRRVAELLQPVAEKKKQKFTVSIADSPPMVLGNSDYLERAVANLVDNAIKYTPEGGAIEVRVLVDGGQVVLEVEDNGIGIPEEDLPRIFERFYRVDRSRSRDMGGTGLGLSIVKHIAQVHRGSVEVTSTPGQGSCFTLRLPALD